ncbi:Cullin-domain-containing protein [Rozella allomycis CSF55]|uniref:Cullin-5 n=1 Tax=Rozella allomycis (strain CSF55) TaxID=988480 RepID=A0A4P9YGD6_ROZAC|nr:Cullin-domain-containing protein [Rozella allomycis CSF55]
MSLRRKPVDFDAVWGIFEKNITKLFESSEEGTVQAMDLTQMVYEMCNAYPNSFFSELKNKISNFLSAQAIKQRKAIMKDVDMIKKYSNEWDVYYNALCLLNTVCSYLNRCILMKKESDGAGSSGPDFYTIDIIGKNIWRENVILWIKRNFSNKLVSLLLSYIEDDRSSGFKDSKHANCAINSFVVLSDNDPLNSIRFYIDEFENLMLQETEKYYKSEGKTNITNMNIESFMDVALRRLAEEKERANRYFKFSFDKVVEVYIDQVIITNQKFIQEEFQKFVANDSFIEMEKAYNLLVLVNEGINPLLIKLKDHIVKLGREILGGLGDVVIKDAKPFITAMLNLHNKYDYLVSQHFNKDTNFETILDKAFREIINDRKTNKFINAPENLARFCDTILKRNSKVSLTEAEIEENLSNVDVFSQFYSKFFGKRLIQKSSVSMECEVGMITKLKVFRLLNLVKDVCGFEYVSKLQRMYTDITVSETMHEKFLQNYKSSLSNDFEFAILTAGSWPSAYQNNQEFIPPFELGQCIKQFHDFYEKEHSGRKLTWLYNQSRCDLKLTGFDKRYELQVSVFQSSILLTLNKEGKIQLHQIAEETKLPIHEIKRNIKPLLELGIILENENIQEISINDNFSHKRVKIKVPSIAINEPNEKERDSVKKAVEDDRKMYIQASIVRIAKAKKEISHNDLVQEIISHAKPQFLPSIALIKSMIEHLIEKQFLERHPSEKGKYIYVA